MLDDVHIRREKGYEGSIFLTQRNSSYSKIKGSIDVFVGRSLEEMVELVSNGQITNDGW